jgi:hypothetical protein
MASNILEFFGFHPLDRSALARDARQRHRCPFIEAQCTKTLHDGSPSGACTLQPKNGGPVICCPNRLYAESYKILTRIADQAFGPGLSLVPGSGVRMFGAKNGSRGCIAVFGKRYGKEIRLPSRGNAGAYSVDWILAHVDSSGELVGFVAVEVQSIDTTGNYQAERAAYLSGTQFDDVSTAGFNWENVNKRILPQIIYKGHVLRREPLCTKGLFFVCPTAVYRKIQERLGNKLDAIHQQAGSVTMMWYDIEPPVPEGSIRSLRLDGQFTTTIDQVALAFTAPSNLPKMRAYEEAIRAEL